MESDEGTLNTPHRASHAFELFCIVGSDWKKCGMVIGLYIRRLRAMSSALFVCKSVNHKRIITRMDSFVDCISCCEPTSLPQLLEQSNDQRMQTLGVVVRKACHA